MSEFPRQSPNWLPGPEKMTSPSRAGRPTLFSAGGCHAERRASDGEMSEGELVDAFRHVSDAFSKPAKPSACAPTTRSTTWCVTSAEPLYQRAGGRERNLPSAPLGIGITDYYIRQREFSTLAFLCSCRLWRVSSNARQMPPRGR